MAEKQIDYDILPSDKLGLADNYEYIVVPYAAYLPEEIERKLAETGVKKALRLKSASRAELNAVANKLPKTLHINGTGASRIRVMKFAGKEKYFLHNEGNRTAVLKAESCGSSVCLTDALTGETECIAGENGSIAITMRSGQAVFMESAQKKAKPQTTKKVRPIPFTKIAEDDTSVTYSACANSGDGERIKIEYSGEFARVYVGKTERDFIGGIAYFTSTENTQNITIKIYKNLAEQKRDEFSKWSILRPAELKAIQISG